MTAEIVIMNKEAVALAADSAVTGKKVFTSANKLFALSKYHPVGIMIYGNANFMGVPWEIIIKVYRKNLKTRKFDTLREYANHFIAFLDGGNRLFPYKIQDDYLRETIYSYLSFLKRDIMEMIHSALDKEGKIDDHETVQTITKVIENHYNRWESISNIPSISKKFNKYIIAKNKKFIDQSIKEVFEKLPLTRTQITQITRILGSLFSKFPEDVLSEDVSGVVIAGFGEKDTFPSTISFDIEGIIYNKLKYRKRMDGKVDFNNSAGIVPFAQREMVVTFMEGVDPFYKNIEESYLSEIFNNYAEIFIDKMAIPDNTEKKKLKRNMIKIGKGMLQEHAKKLEDYRHEKYVQPIMDVVSMLPKDDLAGMAESLVNLTSFKRKVTLDESVGGPIDVAVISKGDGFVWIKRKLYFKADLNPQFFANYYQEV
jgi:hypothetical protein